MKHRILLTSKAIAALSLALVDCVPNASPPVGPLTIPEPARAASALVVAGPSAPLTSPSAIPAGVTELACGREKELQSVESTESLELDFQNATDGPVTLEWLNFNGGRVHYAVLQPGESYRQQTYVTHPWLAVDPAGTCLRVFVPKATGLYTVRILGPDQRATTRWK